MRIKNMSVGLTKSGRTLSQPFGESPITNE